MHDGLKDQVKLSGCYSGRKCINEAYWELVYLLYYLIRVFQREYSTEEMWFTVDQLVEWYQFEYDVARARKHFRTTDQIQRAKRRLLPMGVITT